METHVLSTPPQCSSANVSTMRYVWESQGQTVTANRYHLVSKEKDTQDGGSAQTDFVHFLSTLSNWVLV